MVKCEQCGRVGVRNASGQLVEVTEQLRADGYRRDSDGALRIPTPVCQAQVVDLSQGYSATSPQRFKDVLLIDRGNCPGFTKHRPGYTPQKHEQMMFQEKLFELQEKVAKLQQDHAEWERKWKPQEQAVLEVRHQEDRADSSESQAVSKTHHWQTLVSQFIIAVLAVILTLIGQHLVSHFWPDSGAPKNQTTAPTHP